MKLNKLHLFLIVIFVLLASSLGFSMVEYFQSEIQQENEELENNNSLDSFDNGNYDSIIGDLEDVIIPERRQRKNQHGGHGNNRKGKKCNKNKENSASSDKFNPDPSKYILKSEIVPPVCPKCPESRTCPRQKPCPPCAPCARCPEPSFTCKKVPNYSVSTVGTNNILPMPQLNSFAAFN